MATRQIKLRYIKSPDYRISLATGVFGGVGSNGLINMNFYVDRGVIPKSETVEIDEQGKVINRIEREVDGDAIREVHSGALLDIKAAKNLIVWLQKTINEHEQRFNKS